MLDQSPFDEKAASKRLDAVAANIQEEYNATMVRVEAEMDAATPGELAPQEKYMKDQGEAHRKLKEGLKMIGRWPWPD